MRMQRRDYGLGVSAGCMGHPSVFLCCRRNETEEGAFLCFCAVMGRRGKNRGMDSLCLYSREFWKKRRALWINMM